MRQIVIFIMILIIPSISFAQISTNCLTESELLRLQKSSYMEVNAFLINKGWSLENDQENQSARYFGFHLNYSVRKWTNKTTGFVEPILFFYYQNNLPNLIIYQATNNCFTNLLNNQSLPEANSYYKALVLNKPGRIALEFREYLNELTFIRFSVLIYNVPSLKLQNGDSFFNQEKYINARSLYNQAFDLLNSDENRLRNEIIEKIDNCNRRIKIIREISIGDSLFNQMNYIDAKSHFEIAKDLLREGELRLQNEIATKIGNCNEGLNQIEIRSLIKVALSKGDSLFNCLNYNEAKNQYDEASRLSKRLKPNDPILESETSFKLDRSDLMESLKYGDDYFNKGLKFESLSEYNKALSEYSEALLKYEESSSKIELNPYVSDVTVELRIKTGVDTSNYRIERIKNWQKTISFCSQHPIECNEFKKLNFNVLNYLITSTYRTANMNYTVFINYDNKGKDNNYIKINSSSHKKLNSYIEKIPFSGFTATRKLDYFIPSTEKLSFDISWDANRLLAIARSDRIKLKPNMSKPAELKNHIASYINGQSFKNGIYKFQVTNKIINGTSSNDVSLIKHINNSGPLNSAYSLLIPGLGSLRVTDGERGSGIIKTFLLASIISAGSKIYSEHEYDKYLKTSPESDAIEHHELANTANKVFLISGGIAATIYIYDFFWTIGKGISNNKQSKVLKEKLKSGPIKIY